MNKSEESKAKAVAEKLKTERNKYFVPELGVIEADDIADVENDKQVIAFKKARAAEQPTKEDQEDK